MTLVESLRSAGLIVSDIVAQTGKATISLEDDWLIRTVYRAGVNIELEDAQTELGVYRELAKVKKRVCIVDLRAMKSITAEARARYSQDDGLDLVHATALLISSAVSRVIGNFYLTLNKPAVPTRMFNDEALAIDWLEGMSR